MALLSIKNLSVDFNGFKAVDNISISLDAGEILGIVGESGSGKSVTQLAIMDLIDYPGKVTADAITFENNNNNILKMTNKQKRALMGSQISMIFQDPMNSLNPVYTIGYQIAESLKTHTNLKSKEVKKRVVELLNLVGIADPEERYNSYPHQLSGGMNQRVMIAMAISCNPKLLIADEPTTALDVTIQAQIMDLLLELQRNNEMAMIIISHDMGVIAEVAHKVVVMYAGQVVEVNSKEKILTNPCHPYTVALLKTLPENSLNAKRLPTILGVVPGKDDRPQGCLFSTRCFVAKKECFVNSPKYIGNDKVGIKCFNPLINGEIVTLSEWIKDNLGENS